MMGTSLKHHLQLLGQRQEVGLLPGSRWAVPRFRGWGLSAVVTGRDARGWELAQWGLLQLPSSSRHSLFLWPHTSLATR